MGNNYVPMSVILDLTRNPEGQCWVAVILTHTVIPRALTVIPAKAGIHRVGMTARQHQPTAPLP